MCQCTGVSAMTMRHIGTLNIATLVNYHIITLNIMKLLSKSLLLAVALLIGATAMAQVTLGYTDGTINRSKSFRLGTAEKQGMAIYLDAEKAKMLKGATVKSVLTCVATTFVEGQVLFISKDLGGTPLYTQSFKPGNASRFTTYDLATPYVFDGEPCYIGWVGDADLSYPALSFDMSKDFASGTCWGYMNDGWVDVSSAGYGAPNIRIVVDGVEGFVDLTAKPLSTTGYQKAGTPQVFGGQLFNFGSETVTSFDITCKLGNGEPMVTSVTGVSLKSGAVYDFTLPEYLTDESGELELEISVGNINGVADADVSDNISKSSTYFYPADVQKKVLVEVFTGQACGNCPAGHTALANAMKGMEDDFIEVAHHAGYYPDAFSMAESWEYVWLYGSSGSYAPGATFNRTETVSSSDKPSVVFASNSQSSCNAAVQAFRDVQPYVDLKMYNEFDEATRKGTVTVDVFTYVSPSDAIHALNVWLVQDGLVGYQASGGAEYVHNHVFCVALTNSAWGQQLPLVPGETVRRTFQYEIPDEMYPTYYEDSLDRSFPAVPANMQLVAFVSDVSSTDPLACNVYNAAKIEVLADNMAEGVEEMEAVQSNAVVSVSGNTVNLLGEHAGAEVYSVTGSEAARINAGEQSFTLSAGIYLVRVRQVNGAVTVCKLVIR